MLPNPNELFASFEKGEIKREELQSLMALHARELIQEMEEDYQNPAAALIENLLARRAASKLIKGHGEKLVREILCCLSGKPNFPPAGHLWNAGHPDLPLYCFFRMRRSPVFRLLEIETAHREVKVVVEHGSPKKAETLKQTIRMIRDDQWRLNIA